MRGSTVATYTVLYAPHKNSKNRVFTSDKPFFLLFWFECFLLGFTPRSTFTSSARHATGAHHEYTNYTITSGVLLAKTGTHAGHCCLEPKGHPHAQESHLNPNTSTTELVKLIDQHNTCLLASSQSTSQHRKFTLAIET